MEQRIHEVEQITDLKDMLNKSAIKFSEKPAFKFKTEKVGEFRVITYSQFKSEVDALGTTLIQLGMKGKKIAVISENRYEWALAYLAITTGTGIVVPLDKSLPEQEIESLILRSEVEAIFYSKSYDEIMNKMRAKAQNKIKKYISMDLIKEQDGILSENELIEKGKKLLTDGNKEFINAKINPEEMQMMLFTSGTTSMSKAVMLSHKNICTNIMDIGSVIKLTEEDTMLSFLPLHHTFECTVGFLYPLSVGTSIAYCEGIRHIADNVKEYQITAMISVPLLFESMYKKVMKGIEKKGKLDTVKKAIKLSRFLLKFNIDIRKKLFKEIHDMLGGKVRLFVNGAAALDQVAEQGFNDLGFKTVQGYGLTETSPVVAAGNDKYTRVGSVGKVFPSLEVKIVDKNEDGIGEIVVKGPSVMLGYYQNDEATSKVLKSGWFYTGDLGYFDKDNYLYISGRQKNVIVLKNGKNIFPEEIENLINRIEGVKESFVYGKPDKGDDLKLCAKIVYDKDSMKEIFNIEEVNEIKEKLWENIKQINKTMPPYKYIREIIVTDEELIKTTTQKVKRFEEIKRINGENKK